MDKRLIRNALNAEKIDQAVARYRAGESIRTLATSFGCAYGTMRTALHAAEVEVRPRGANLRR